MTYTQALLKKKAKQQDDNDALIDTAVVLGGAGLGYLTSKVVDPQANTALNAALFLTGSSGGVQVFCLKSKKHRKNEL